MLLDDRDTGGVTPLLLATSAGHAEVVALLIKSGANVTLKTADGSTALHKAAQQGNVNIVKQLLQAGADARLADNQGRTPLALAEKRRKGEWEEVARCLREAEKATTP